MLFSIRLGVFLRRYPIARLMLIVYMVGSREGGKEMMIKRGERKVGERAMIKRRGEKVGGRG